MGIFPFPLDTAIFPLYHLLCDTISNKNVFNTTIAQRDNDIDTIGDLTSESKHTWEETTFRYVKTPKERKCLIARKPISDGR